MLRLLQTIWRRERDSNPRYRFQYTGLANQRLQPLGHLSKPAISVKELPTDDGGGRIRTYEGLAPLAVFKTAAFSRSATPPTAAGDAPETGARLHTSIRPPLQPRGLTRSGWPQLGPTPPMYGPSTSGSRHGAVLPLVVLEDGDHACAPPPAPEPLSVWQQLRLVALVAGGSGSSRGGPGSRRSWSRSRSPGRRPARAARPRCRRSSAEAKPMSPVQSSTTRWCSPSWREDLAGVVDASARARPWSCSGGGELHQLHLVELVLADEPAGVLARRRPPRRGSRAMKAQ